MVLLLHLFYNNIYGINKCKVLHSTCRILLYFPNAIWLYLIGIANFMECNNVSSPRNSLYIVLVTNCKNSLPFVALPQIIFEIKMHFQNSNGRIDFGKRDELSL